MHVDTTALTMCIAAKALFNAEVKKDVAEIGQAFNAIVEEIAVRLRRPFRILDAVPTPGNIRYVRAVHRIDRLVTKIIRERREQGGDRGDLLSILLLGRDEENQSMSERQLRDEVITLLVAGHETTAIALSWTWYLLAHSPDVDAKLAAELRDVLGGRAPTVSDLAQLTFTQQVVTEALRIYPPAWGFGREALADCEIGGYFIPAGTTIIISPWVLHRDPRYFEHPTEFRPERWSGDFARQLPRFAYIPFGGASHLHRQSVCYDGDDLDPGHCGATIPIAMARRPAGRAAALDYAPSERWHSGPAGAPRSIVLPASFASMQALYQCGGDARG